MSVYSVCVCVCAVSRIVLRAFAWFAFLVAMLTAVGCEELPDSLLPTLSFASAFSSDQVDDDRAARGGATKDGCGSRPVVVMVKEGVILAVPQPTGGRWHIGSLSWRVEQAEVRMEMMDCKAVMKRRASGEWLRVLR